LTLVKKCQRSNVDLTLNFDRRKATKNGTSSERVMLWGDARTWDECGRNIEKTEHRVLNGKRIGYEGPANRRRARIEAFG